MEFVASCGGGSNGTDLTELEVPSDPLLSLLSTDASADGFEQYWSCNDNVGGDGLVLSFWDEAIQTQSGGVTHNAAAVAKSASAMAEAWEWQSSKDSGDTIEIVSPIL